MKYLIFLCLATFGTPIIDAQILRQSPYNYLNRPETVIEAGNFMPAPSPSVISEPINSLVPLPNVVSEPSTTIITDCSPSICKNLANTIQLMIVCNLLQNNRGKSDIAMQLAAPILNEVMSSPTLSCGCCNPFDPTMTPNLIAPSIVTPNLITPNFVQPHFIPNNIVSSNALGPNYVPLSPRSIAPSCPCANSASPSIAAVPPSMPIGSQLSNAKSLINTLMGLLGNMQG